MDIIIDTSYYINITEKAFGRQRCKLSSSILLEWGGRFKSGQVILPLETVTWNTNVPTSWTHRLFPRCEIIDQGRRDPWPLQKDNGGKGIKRNKNVKCPLEVKRDRPADRSTFPPFYVLGMTRMKPQFLGSLDPSGLGNKTLCSLSSFYLFFFYFLFLSLSSGKSNFLSEIHAIIPASGITLRDQRPYAAVAGSCWSTLPVFQPSELDFQQILYTQRRWSCGWVRKSFRIPRAAVDGERWENHP